MEDLIKALERYMAGTIIRGLLWVSSYAAALTGIAELESGTITQIGSFLGAVAAGGLALLWSRAKDKINKKTHPSEFV